ncbi:MAG: hypothetical protein ACI4B3_06045, partial [Prevotella sp.]
MHKTNHHPTVEEPNMQFTVMFYDAAGSDSFFLHDATEGENKGPALYVDGKYICSPDYELAWPGSNNTGNQDGIEDQRKYNGWWGNTYTNTVDGVTYTVKFWDPGRSGDKYGVNVHVFMDKYRVGEKHTVTIKGMWKINNNGAQLEEYSWTFDPISNPFDESSLAVNYTDYQTATLTGNLNGTYENNVAVSRDYPGTYVDGKTQYVEPEDFSLNKTFDKGTSTTGNMSFTIDSSYPDYGPYNIYVQHQITSLPTQSGYVECKVWNGTWVSLPDFMRAKNITATPDKWKKQITLNWEAENSNNEYSTGTWSIYYYPLDDPGNKSKLTEGLLNTTRKYVADVTEYDTDYVFELEFRPKNITDAERIERLVVRDTSAVIRDFSIKIESVEAGESSIKLSWQTEQFKGTLPLTFNILRQNVTGTDWENIGTTTLTNQKDVKFSYVDESINSACDGYIYKIQATMLEGYLATSDSTDIVRINGQSQVTSVTATKGDYQGLVKLTWESKQVDTTPTTYELLRRVKGTSNWASLYKVSSTNTLFSYEDNTAQPGLYYDYRVVSTTSCNSGETQIYKTDDGFCRATGIVSGRITYGTGTAVQDARVSLVKNSENASDAAQFYAVSTQEAGDGIFLDLDGKALNEKFSNKAFTVQMFVRPNIVQNGSTPVFFDLGNQLSLRLGNYNEDSAGYELLLAQGETTESTGIILPTRDYTSLTLSVSKDNKAVITAIDKLDTVVVSKEIALSAISFDDAANSGLCMGGSHELNLDNAFSGYVDEMRVFTGKALTKAEILKNYNHMLA